MRQRWWTTTEELVDDVWNELLDNIGRAASRLSSAGPGSDVEGCAATLELARFVAGGRCTSPHGALRCALLTAADSLAEREVEKHVAAPLPAELDPREDA